MLASEFDGLGESLLFSVFSCSWLAGAVAHHLQLISFRSVSSATGSSSSVCLYGHDKSSVISSSRDFTVQVRVLGVPCFSSRFMLLYRAVTVINRMCEYVYDWGWWHLSLDCCLAPFRELSAANIVRSTREILQLPEVKVRPELSPTHDVSNVTKSWVDFYNCSARSRSVSFVSN